MCCDFVCSHACIHTIDNDHKSECVDIEPSIYEPTLPMCIRCGEDTEELAGHLVDIDHLACHSAHGRLVCVCHPTTISPINRS